jgi:hypothetical protein
MRVNACAWDKDVIEIAFTTGEDETSDFIPYVVVRIDAAVARELRKQLKRSIAVAEQVTS